MSSKFQQIEQLQTLNIELQKRLNDAVQQIKRSDNENMRMKSKIKKLENHQSVSPTKPQEQQQINKEFIDPSYLQQSRRVGEFLDFELRSKDEEIKRLKNLLDERTQLLAGYKVTAERGYDSRQQHIIDQTASTQEIDKIKQEIYTLKREYDLTLLEKNQQGVFLIELDHLRQDYQQLLKMLKSTKEYRDLAGSQLETDGRLRYLHKMGASNLNEKSLWVPEKAHSFALQFKLQYEGQVLSEQLIETLLFELNKIWQKKIDSDINYTKKSQQGRVSQLERSKDLLTHDEVASKQTIERLRKDISRLERENRELFVKRPDRNPESGSRAEQVTHETKTQKSLKDKDKRIDHLQRSLTQFNKQEVNKTNEKLMYYDGALWMNKQIQEQIKMCEDVNQVHMLVQKLNKQVKQASSYI